MRISDWSSDVCSSDLGRSLHLSAARTARKNTRNAETVALVRKAMMSPAAKQENTITSLLYCWSRKRERQKKASPTLREASMTWLMHPAATMNLGMARVRSSEGREEKERVNTGRSSRSPHYN